MKTSTTLLIAAGAVVATVGIASLASADGRWMRSGDGHPHAGMRGWMTAPMSHRHHGRGPDGPMGGMMRHMLVQRVVEMADKDGDGKLSGEEIEAFRAEIFQTHDADGDGRLSLEEYDSMFREITRPVMVRTFQFLDPNGDALISMEEFRAPTDRLARHLEHGSDRKSSYSGRWRGYGPAREDPRDHDRRGGDPEN